MILKWLLEFIFIVYNIISVHLYTICISRLSIGLMDTYFLMSENKVHVIFIISEDSRKN